MKDIYSNNEETAALIAHTLKKAGSCIIAVAVDEYTQLDVLFTILDHSGIENFFGMVQGGLQHGYIYVSVMRVGAFAFRLDTWKSADYIAEKIFRDSAITDTSAGLATLINNTISAYTENE